MEAGFGVRHEGVEERRRSKAQRRPHVIQQQEWVETHLLGRWPEDKTEEEEKAAEVTVDVDGLVV